MQKTSTKSTLTPNDKAAIALHKKLHGKISVQPKVKIKRDLLKLVYTPGVAAVSTLLATSKKAGKDETNTYTWRGNTVAVVSDGSAVLGLGNIGPEGALPVMEGKAYLFKALAGIDAVPIVLATQDTEEIIKTVQALAPSFAAINLEDISAPRCFEIEKRLRETMPIPVMHDDQHGTAVVVLAGIINALKVVGKKKGDVRAVIVGSGAAGSAVAEMLLLYGIGDVTVCDRKGVIDMHDTDMHKAQLAMKTNKAEIKGALSDAMIDADIVLGVSGPNTISAEMVANMKRGKKGEPQAIVFAMANPIPEIMPDVAKKAGAAVVATGRSDFPNQINNSLGFPGIFRGALDHGVVQFTPEMFIRAAENLAKLVPKPTANKVIPDPLDPKVVGAVAKAFKIR
jgi:malate dehydrogenase (oxaloacetate-decarboxylating)